MAVKIKGLDKAIKELSKKGDLAVNEIKFQIESVATKIELDAINNVKSQFDPADFNIAGRIDKVFDNQGLSVKVGLNVGTFFDGWYEFGTGADYLRRVASDPKYTPDIQNQARQFLGKIAPYTGRLLGRPYFYPAYFKNTANFVENLKKAVADAIK
jgi:hypothetical protein